MSRHTFGYCAVFLLVGLLSSGGLMAQGVCDQGNGSLNTVLPSGLTPAQIIQKFAAKEAAFKAARDRYGYTLNVTIQTLDNFGQVARCNANQIYLEME